MDQDWVEHSLPENIKLVKVPCSSRIDPLYILNTVQAGAQGIMVCGCMPAKCHFKEGNLHARRTLHEFRNFLNALGYSQERFAFHWMNIDERGLLQTYLADFEEQLLKLDHKPYLATRRFSEEKVE